MQFRSAPRVVRGSLFAASLLAFASIVACSGDGGDGAGGAGSSGGGTSPAGSRPAGLPQYKCPAAPKGVDVGTFTGDQLPELFVKDGDGNDVSLSQFCGADAMWLYSVHMWCPHTKKVGGFSEAIADAYKSKNVVSVSIIYQNADHAPPTQADCRQWRDTYGLADNITLYDPTGVTKPLNDSTFTSLSLYIDKDRVIRGKSHTDDETAIRQGIDGVLPKK